MGSTGAENTPPLLPGEPRERWTEAIPAFLLGILFWFLGIVLSYGVATEAVNGKLMAEPSHDINLIEGAIGFVAIASVWTWGMVRKLVKDSSLLRAKRR